MRPAIIFCLQLVGLLLTLVSLTLGAVALRESRVNARAVAVNTAALQGAVTRLRLHLPPAASHAYDAAQPEYREE